MEFKREKTGCQLKEETENDAEEKGRARSNTRAVQVMGRGRTHHHITKQRSEDESRRRTIAMD